jgi:hypothetical protein
MWPVPKPHKIVSRGCLDGARLIGSAKYDERADDLIRKVGPAIDTRLDDGGRLAADDQAASHHASAK